MAFTGRAFWPARGLRPFRHPGGRLEAGPSGLKSGNMNARRPSAPARNCLRTSVGAHMFFLFYAPRTDIDSISRRTRSSGFSHRRSCCENCGCGPCFVDWRSRFHRRDLCGCAHDWPEIEADRVADATASRSTSGQATLLRRAEKSDVSVGYGSPAGGLPRRFHFGPGARRMQLAMRSDRRQRGRRVC
jgi:hypothetical protein